MNVHLRFLYLAGLMLIILGCINNSDPELENIPVVMEGNLLLDSDSENIVELNWINQPSAFNITDGQIEIIAEKETDFFNNPEDGSISATAPLLFIEQNGDFVAKALVKPDFSSLWNAACLMVHIDSLNWIKFAFENSDATGKSIVTVVTKGVSDDANGVILETEDQVWLKMIRKGNIYSMLWSLDDENYKMARLTSLPEAENVKIGVEVQCPVGESAKHKVLYFGVEEKTVEDLRKGK